MTMRGFGRQAATAGWLFLVIAVAACSRHRLDEYDFMDHTVAVVTSAPASARLDTGPITVVRDNPLEMVLEAGGRVVREVEVRGTRARLDSASARVDVGERMSERSLERTARYLGARPVADRRDADYLLEVFVEWYGIEAKDWDAAAYLVMGAEVVLLDNRTGTEIWDEDVRAWEALTPRVYHGGVARDVVTASVLSTLSVEELEGVLERVADLASDHVTGRLRHALRDVRRR